MVNKQRNQNGHSKNGDDKPENKPDHEFEQQTPHDPSQPEKANRSL